MRRSRLPDRKKLPDGHLQSRHIARFAGYGQRRGGKRGLRGEAGGPARPDDPNTMPGPVAGEHRKEAELMWANHTRVTLTSFEGHVTFRWVVAGMKVVTRNGRAGG